jgi:hypothetical protein
MPEKLPVKKMGFSPKPRTKHFFWNAGLYLTPFVFAGVLIVWGHLLAPWMVIGGAILVLGLFVGAGILHIKENGGLSNYVRAHLWSSISLIVLFACVILGTTIYLAMRPTRLIGTTNTPKQDKPEKSATEPPKGRHRMESLKGHLSIPS